MSADTLSRILERTNARLSVAFQCDEVRAIGLEHMCAVAADTAETLFLHITSGKYTEDEISEASLLLLDGLLQGLVDQFEEIGAGSDPYLERCLYAITDAFGARYDALCMALQIGGRA